MVAVQFHGTRAEAAVLLAALNRNCTCVYDGPAGTTRCAVHIAFANEQRFSDGLVYERRRCASRFPGARNRVIHATEAPHAQ